MDPINIIPIQAIQSEVEQLGVHKEEEKKGNMINNGQEQVNTSLYKDSSPRRKLHHIISHELSVEEIAALNEKGQEFKSSKNSNIFSKIGKENKIRKNEVSANKNPSRVLTRGVATKINHNQCFRH